MLRTLAATLLCALSLPTWATPCGDAHTPIAEVQGHSDKSPLLNHRVSVEAILTVDLRHPGGFQGFYLQQAAKEQDDNVTTSEGLFIHTHARAGKPGDRVRVEGIVQEYHGLTSLTDVSRVDVCDHPGLPSPQALRADRFTNHDREPLESMLVQSADPLVITETWNLARFGELVLAPSLQWVPTQLMAPGPKAAQLEREQQRQRLLLDDGYRHQYPQPVPYLSGLPAPGNPLRVGDRVDRVAGVLDYRFGHWRLQPISHPRIQHANPRRMPPRRDPRANLRVMSLNLGNLFNGDGQGGGFPTERGAATLEDYQRQIARLARQILATGPDILAVAELENDGYHKHSAVAALARELGDHWRFIDGGTDRHSDAIRNGLLYRSDRVQPRGPATLIRDQAFAQWHRPALAQGFRPAGSDDAITVVAVHLKSKSCRNAPHTQQDAEDGQGCFAAARTEAARQLAQWQPPRSDTDHPMVLLAGDFNAYAMETPLQALTEAGYTDLAKHFRGPKQQTFRYHGRQGTLDYHLANQSLRGRVTASRIWSVNAEELRILDYDADTASSLPETFLWRASDHNPVITDIAL